MERKNIFVLQSAMVWIVSIAAGILMYTTKFFSVVNFRVFDLFAVLVAGGLMSWALYIKQEQDHQLDEEMKKDKVLKEHLILAGIIVGTMLLSFFFIVPKLVVSLLFLPIAIAGTLFLCMRLMCLRSMTIVTGVLLGYVLHFVFVHPYHVGTVWKLIFG